MEFLDSLIEKYGKYCYFLARVIVGIMFMQHGLGKLFGVFGGNQQELMSLMGLAGCIETIVGLFVALGLFVRIFSVLGALHMLVAYFMGHFAVSNMWAVMNGGELALMYFAAFTFLKIYGSGIWSLQSAFVKK